MPALTSLGTTEVVAGQINARSPRLYAFHQVFLRCEVDVVGAPVNLQDVKEYTMDITAHSCAQHC
eukprot:2849390-Karenia_brevis.AAC.1